MSVKRILAVSTSAGRASVAFMENGELIAERRSEGVSHSSAVGVMTDELMASVGREMSDIDCLAVDIGPGSFTGVRIGVSFINGIALALDLPIIPVTSLEALRFNAPDEKTVAAMIDARNSSVYAALFDGNKAVSGPDAFSTADFIAQIPDGAFCVGDAVHVYSELREKAADVTMAPVQKCEVTAASVASAAYAGEGTGAVKFAVPLYLRPSQAERVRDSRKNS